MKRLMFLVLLTTLFSSCRKDEQVSDIVGQWEWYLATGGIANIYQTPQNSGFSWQLRLNANYTSEQTGDLMIVGNGNGTFCASEKQPQHVIPFFFGQDRTIE